MRKILKEFSKHVVDNFAEPSRKFEETEEKFYGEYNVIWSKCKEMSV